VLHQQMEALSAMVSGPLQNRKKRKRRINLTADRDAPHRAWSWGPPPPCYKSRRVLPCPTILLAPLHGMAPLSTVTLLAILAATAALAAPTPLEKSSARKNVAAIVPAVPSTLLHNVAGTVEPLVAASSFVTAGPVNQLQAALDFVRDQLAEGFTFQDYEVKDSYVTKHNGPFSFRSLAVSSFFFFRSSNSMC
jgi:hypothetical protein